MSKYEPDPKVVEFLQKLFKLDAGDKARLKRDAGKLIAESQSLGLFYRLLPYGLSTAQEEIFFLLATLYPLGDEGGTGNFGASLRLARDPKNPKGLDRRVEILLDSDKTQLPFRLRQAVRLLKSKHIAINWQQLLVDLKRWNYTSRIVQKQWARTYFGLAQKLVDENDSTLSESEFVISRI